MKTPTTLSPYSLLRDAFAALPRYVVSDDGAPYRFHRGPFIKSDELDAILAQHEPQSGETEPSIGDPPQSVGAPVPPKLTPDEAAAAAPAGFSWDETGAWAMGYEHCRKRFMLAAAPTAPVSPEPSIHSYDPTDARATVTVHWPDGTCLAYTLDRTKYTDMLPREWNEGGGDVVALPMGTAPRDGTLVRLLVEFEEHNVEDGENPAWTIGAVTVIDDDPAVFQFVGWNWCQDHWTDGIGTPVGWLPFHPAPTASDGDMPANAKHWHDLYRAECLARQDDASRYGQRIAEMEATIAAQSEGGLRELIAAAERARDVLHQIVLHQIVGLQRKIGPIATQAQSAAWGLSFALKHTTQPASPTPPAPDAAGREAPHDPDLCGVTQVPGLPPGWTIGEFTDGSGFYFRSPSGDGCTFDTEFEKGYPCASVLGELLRTLIAKRGEA